LAARCRFLSNLKREHQLQKENIMSKIDDVKLALANLRDVATRVRDHATNLSVAASDTSQLDEVLTMVKDITVQLEGTLPVDTTVHAATDASVTTATD
jgi:hypothetical protein